MEAVTYSNFRQGLKSYLKQVNQDSEPLIVTSQNSDDNIVVISKNDYDEMMETMRMVSNPYLMEKIRKGDKQVKKSQFKTDH
ncbi:type II toxin-antitoxin system Phd/YefM family antitoxin [Lentilactobacillus diolivorans]|uniref:type II toxin-antitoxin system Phd/YefM family antitoxin n=1 Tax=Lentilactobacillus diolivorans TaxID=179838 RepID=UPI002468A7A8|nr:type II toxin-antitoxin system Phd/YefM family antitoxin [Lentilactobacillus diolivorans]MDH5106344.1 type II toxin-antitoxin system Phd/YefM family antitoxin [Lentilactobacillus diolivorans]